jgi:hypothetical protein
LTSRGMTAWASRRRGARPSATSCAPSCLSKKPLTLVEPIAVAIVA